MLRLKLSIVAVHVYIYIHTYKHICTYACMYAYVSVSVRASETSVAPMGAGLCPDRCRRPKPPRNPPLLLTLKAKRAPKLLSWIGLCIIAQCLARPTLLRGTPHPSRPYKMSNCNCRSELCAQWNGSATLFSGFSVGNPGVALWKRSRDAPAGLFRPRWLPGGERRANFLPMRCWRERQLIWMMPQPEPCGRTSLGSAHSCANSLKEMTGPGSLQQGTSFAPANRCCSRTFGRVWCPVCSSASLKAWFRRLRTPFLIWPRLCGTRTTSWFCCHGLLRRSSCSSNNGSRSTSGTSFLLCREAPGRLHHCPARSQIVLPFLGAPTIPLRNEQLGHWACRQLGADIRTDRLGPNSVDMWHTSTSESRTGSLIVLAVNMLTPRSCVPHVDVRVEGRLGCTPSEAASFALAVCRMEAKHWTLSKFSKTVLKGQASLEFFLQST